jgi:guanylate kinase
MSNELLGATEKGLIFVVSAPAGAGKTSLVTLLTQEFSNVVMNISYTTRAPRKGEQHGVDYFFISDEEFSQKEQAGEFLENVNLFSARYGASRVFIEKMQQEKKHVVLVIDTQGAKKLMEMINCISIFILPPSKEELEKRLEGRGTESRARIEERLSWSNHELEMASHYQYQILNDTIERAYQVLRSIVIAETHRVQKVIH